MLMTHNLLLYAIKLIYQTMYKNAISSP